MIIQEEDKETRYMRTTKLFIISIIAVLMAACTKEVPREVIISAKQMSIEGNTAHIVHSDTSDIILLRDSLADEKSGLYTVHASITLVLDSIFHTDQMEDSLTMRLLTSEGQELAALIPTDSLLADSLFVFLQSTTGNNITINFDGQTSGESILKLQEGGTITLAGFSFIYADPKITKRVDEYQQLVQTLSVMIEDARKNPDRMRSMEGFIVVMMLQEGFNKVEALNKKLLAMKDKMSPLQYAKFKEAHDLMKTYDKDLK